MRTPRTIPTIARATVALVVIVGVAACGGDDDTAAGTGGSGDLSSADTTIEVLAEDISFPEDVYETESGAIGFVYENVGQIRHTLLVEDESGFKLDVQSEGDVDEGVIDLAPGTYTLFCHVPGPRPAGLVPDLVAR